MRRMADAGARAGGWDGRGGTLPTLGVACVGFAPAGAMDGVGRLGCCGRSAGGRALVAIVVSRRLKWTVVVSQWLKWTVVVSQWLKWTVVASQWLKWTVWLSH